MSTDSCFFQGCINDPKSDSCIECGRHTGAKSAAKSDPRNEEIRLLKASPEAYCCRDCGEVSYGSKCKPCARRKEFVRLKEENEVLKDSLKIATEALENIERHALPAAMTEGSPLWLGYIVGICRITLDKLKAPTGETK